MSKIKRAVSLYSLQDQYARGKMTLEDLLRTLEQWGVEGFEFISDQMLHGTPTPSEAALKEWDRLRAAHPLKAVCNDVFTYSKLYKNRYLTRQENIERLAQEIRLAHRLGFTLIRLVSKTPPDIVEPLLGLAERLNVTLALEIHAGMSFNHPATQAFVAEMKRLNTKYVGLVIDFGIFCRRHPRVATSYFRSLGLNPAVADYIDRIFARGADPVQTFRKPGGAQETYPDELRAMFKSQLDMMYVIFSGGYENSPPEILDDFLPYVKHFHGKFYEMTDAGAEYSIPYEDVIRYLQRKGWDGYIASEYEGQRFVLMDQPVDDLNQVKCHQEMLKRLIGA